MSLGASIQEQVDSFLADKRRETAPRTVETYRAIVLGKFLPWCEAQGIEDASEFTLDDWNRYRDELQAQPLSIHYVRSCLRQAKVFLGWIGVPMNRRWRLPKAPQRLLETLTREEIDRLERAATTERDKLIVRVLADTGIRLNELTGLRPSDLRAYTSPRRYYRIRVIGKGDKEREVPIEAGVFKRIHAFAGQGPKRRYIFPLMLFNRGTKELTMREGRLDRWAIGAIFRDLRNKAKIKKPCSAHKLRHAFATYCLQQGMPIEKLQQILGHTTLAMIVTVYSHLTPDDASLAYERVFGRSA